MNMHRQALVGKLADAARAVAVARQLMQTDHTQAALQPLERERLEDLVTDAEVYLLNATAITNQETL